ncbi:FAD-dependent oxidoreductase [Bacillus benzoevorans]|uniref:Thioredoxin reductase n=1 Tax=Bacillus benzoevorans TaxID=1456 RepID=A0A7X0HRB0_9BACI|nr:thioredoxin reductase [Bacillus benzoevorans]
MNYDCIIIGGGIAGLQCAIQLGRYMHQVLVIDAADGRSAICQSYHNILGYPDGVSGIHLREVGRHQAEKVGVHFLQEKAESARKIKGEFQIEASDGKSYTAARVVLATGVMDRIPPFPNLYPCLGISVYVCPDCDGYEVKGNKVIVIGSGRTGSGMAKTLSYWTSDLVYINHGQEPLKESDMDKLRELNVEYHAVPIKEVLASGSQLQGFVLENGETIKGTQAFIAFGGNEVKSELAHQLGVEMLENKHILADPRTKLTNVHGVWAAGDIGVHSEQVTIAMGEGSQAAIWIHKDILSKR